MLSHLRPLSLTLTPALAQGAVALERPTDDTTPRGGVLADEVCLGHTSRCAPISTVAEGENRPLGSGVVLVSTIAERVDFACGVERSILEVAERSAQSVGRERGSRRRSMQQYSGGSRLSSVRTQVAPLQCPPDDGDDTKGAWPDGQPLA